MALTGSRTTSICTIAWFRILFLLCMTLGYGFSWGAEVLEGHTSGKGELEVAEIVAKDDKHIERERLDFDKIKWSQERELKRAELELRRQAEKPWTDPVFVAIIAAVVAGLINALVSHRNNLAERETSAITAVISDEVEASRRGLRFLYEAGLVRSPKTVAQLKSYLGNPLLVVKRLRYVDLTGVQLVNESYARAVITGAEFSRDGKSANALVHLLPDMKVTWDMFRVIKPGTIIEPGQTIDLLRLSVKSLTDQGISGHDARALVTQCSNELEGVSLSISYSGEFELIPPTTTEGAKVIKETLL